MTNKQRILDILQNAGLEATNADDWQGVLGFDPVTQNSLLFPVTWGKRRVRHKITLSRKKFDQLSHRNGKVEHGNGSIQAGRTMVS